MKKVGMNIWRICCKAVILHPLSRGKRDEVEMLKTGDEVRTSTIEKKFSKKTWKSFGGSKKCLTFASAFRKKALKKSSLKDLDISKQVVQVLSGIWQKTETVNTWKQVNKQIRFLSRLKHSLTRIHDILQWRVWSWLRMNASYRLNTCKSRGSTVQQCTGGDRRTGA